MSLKAPFIIAALFTVGLSTASAQMPKYYWQHLPKINKPVFEKNKLNILSFGAKPYGTTLKPIDIEN
jgi:hypothetical protein